MADAMKSSKIAITFEMQAQIIKFRDDGKRICDMYQTFLRFALLFTVRIPVKMIYSYFYSITGLQ
jgi:hypothetical protein